MMRLHVLALPHLTVTRDNSTCAYQTKTRRWTGMMWGRGYPVTLYAPGPQADVSPGVDVVYVTDGPAAPGDPADLWDASLPHWADFNRACRDAITVRHTPGDLVCVIGGTAQQAAVPDGATAVEWGIGYAGTFAPFRVFESSEWMHTVYGEQQGAYGADGRFYDTVIPNFFDPADFPAGQGDGGYALYLGRLIDRKGVRVAQGACERAGVPLLLAGAGDIDDGYGTFLGSVGPERRAELLQGAACLLAPTLYVEPFGGTAVEAQMCGTPAITTGWGAYRSTVAHGTTGYRCRTMGEFAAAVRAAPALDRAAVRDRALSLYSCDTVAAQYDDYLQLVAGLSTDGMDWNTTDPGRIPVPAGV